jgi:two-component system chemotaxis response regulator CheY
VPKNLLIVDDSNAMRQSLGFILSQAGYTVVQAQDGMDAIQKLEGQVFDLVVTDVNMPNLDGIGLTKHIRGAAKHQFTPVLMLTTESQADKMQEGKAAGATGWIVKPFEEAKLLAVVKKLVG